MATLSKQEYRKESNLAIVWLSRLVRQPNIESAIRVFSIQTLDREATLLEEEVP